MRGSILVGHMGEISDIVGAILYLESASFVSGENVAWQRLQGLEPVNQRAEAANEVRRTRE
jgi:hypothetical protein